MRVWRTSIGFLVEAGPTSAPILSSQVAQLSDPRWKEFQDFVLLDEFGIVLRRYDANVYSYEEDLGMTVHAVIEGSFRRLTFTEHMGPAYRVTKDEEILLSDLKPVLADEVETLDLIREGLKSDHNLIIHRAEHRIREAEQLLGSRPPNTDDPPEYLRVVKMVRGRVESFGVQIDKRMLDALARFGELRRALAASDHASTGALPAFQPALDLFFSPAAGPVSISPWTARSTGCRPSSAASCR